jgi:hypothetical protein
MNAFKEIFESEEDPQKYDDGSGFYGRVAALLKKDELTIEEQDEAFKARRDALIDDTKFITIGGEEHSKTYQAAWLLAIFDKWTEGVCDDE